MNVERVRLFVAVTVPEAHLEWLEVATADARAALPDGRWTTREQQHVTLKFLGWTPSDRFDEVTRVVGTVAASHEPGEVRLAGLGAFPSERRVRVLWAGLEDPQDLLGGLARDLEAAFDPLGWPPEGRAFTPHLTLARFKVPARPEVEVPGIDPSGLDPIPVESLVLFRSRLHPQGARYEPLAHVPLGAS